MADLIGHLLCPSGVMADLIGHLLLLRLVILDECAVLCVIADKVFHYPVPAEDKQMIGQSVKEMTVVRYYDQRAFILLQIFFKDFQGDYVQVVCRFVKYQEIRLLQKDGKKVQPSPFSPRKALHRVLKHVVSEEEAAQKMRIVYRFQHSLSGFELHARLVVIADFQGIP